MQIKQIIFDRINHAELIDRELAELKEDEVRVQMVCTTISCGTERANVSGDTRIGIYGELPSIPQFPRTGGYSGAGIVVEVGAKVEGYAVGDRVATSWGVHSNFCNFTLDNVAKIPEGVSFQEAAICHIGSFPLAAVRKTRVEVGESAIVMGLGILGMNAVQFLRIAGAYPVIAADPNPDRRAMALQFGADYAFDPLEEGFAERVKALTTDGKGINAAIEVTGRGEGLNEVLDCMAPFGRVALLGCTRDSNFVVDYYRKVHGPGIELIGAHTMARPKVESHAHYWTHHDDITAELKLIAAKRIHVADMIAETHLPTECEEIYDRLVHDRKFPVCVQFDWTK